MTHETLEEVPDEEWDSTFATNISAFFHLAKAAVPHMEPGEKVESFGGNTPLGRAGQPVGLGPVHVLLASDAGSSGSGARLAVTSGRPIL